MHQQNRRHNNQRRFEKEPPIPEKQKLYNTQAIAPRPATLIQDKKNGKKVELLTNHAIVRLPESTITLQTYKITVILNGREVIKREKAAPVFWKVLQQNRNAFPDPGDFIFNDVDFLWTITPMQKHEGRVDLIRDDPRTNKKTVAASVKWQYARFVTFGASVVGTEESQLLTTLIDAIATARVRHPDQHDKYTVFKRLTFLVMKEPESLDGVALYHPCSFGTDIRLGVSIAVKMNLRVGVTACFDLNHTLFSRPGYPLIRLLIEIIEGGVLTDEQFEEKYDELLKEATPGPANFRLMERIMKGMTLMFNLETKYTQTTKIRNPNGWKSVRAFKFDGFGRSAIQEMFDCDDIEKSVAEHFRDEYHIVLRYPHLPVIRKKSSRRAAFDVFYPFEMISYLVNPTRYDGFLTEDMKFGATELTGYTNDQRFIVLQHLIAQKSIGGAPPVLSDSDEAMRKYGVTVDKNMLKVKATELKPPKILYGNDEIVSDVDGVWEAVGHVPIRQVLQPPTVRGQEKKKTIVLGSILRIDFDAASSDKFKNEESIPDTMKIDGSNFHYLMKALHAAGQPVMFSQDSGFVEVQADFFFRQPMKPGLILNYLKNIKADAESRSNEIQTVVPLVLVIFKYRMSQNTDPRFWNDYNVIKWLGDNEIGVHTQGILYDNYHKILPDPTKCALTHLLVEKMLGKLGVTHRKLIRHKPWEMLTDPAEPTLVLGVDVSHPKTQDRADGGVNSLSIAAVVGNIDHEMCEFRSSCRIQDSGGEQIVSMEEQVLKRLVEFQKNTGEVPVHVVVYRDGICEGDFKKYLFEERLSIERAFEIAGHQKPTLTYIVVSKRHHTRFFHANNEVVKPGTLVEDDVTDTRFYDFFLSSQVAGEKGTVHPMHYYVLYDTWAPMDGFWPGVTHAFTYNFCRTTTSISLPAPVMYAHLAAKRAKETLDGVRVRDYLDNIRDDPMSVASQERFTREINVNEFLDGMTFV